MSRIGKKPVVVPKNVTVKLDTTTRHVHVKGPKGELELTYHQNMTVVQENDQILVTRPNDLKENRALHGLTRKLIDNLIIGVTEGFEKKLLINGVGYKAVVKGNVLELNVGYSHPVEMEMPKGISAKVERNLLTLAGIDKAQLGQFASDVRAVRPPEPYKGAGIRYEDEYVRRKAGKKAA